MDYGQPLAGNDCNCCSGHGEPSRFPEPQTPRQVEQIIPAWMRAMLDHPGGNIAGGIAAPAIVNSHGVLTPVPGYTPVSTKREASFIHASYSDMLRRAGWAPEVLLRTVEKGGNAIVQLEKQLGADRFNDLMSNIKFTDPVTEQSLTQKGIEQMQPIVHSHSFQDLRKTFGEFGIRGPLGKAGLPPVSNQTKELGDISTLSDVVTHHILPDFMQQLTETLKIQDPTERLRENYRIINRLQKLIIYTRKPGRIDPYNVQCPHEFAIYQWAQLNDAVHGRQSECEAHTNIHAAAARIQERNDVREQEAAQQAKNQQRAAVMEQIIGEIGAVEKLVNGLETTQLAVKLREMAAELDRVEAGGEIRQQAQLPFVRGAKPEHQFDGMRQASDGSDMGMDYLARPIARVVEDHGDQAVLAPANYTRQVPTTAGGFSDDKFGGATRAGLVDISPEAQQRRIAEGASSSGRGFIRTASLLNTGMEIQSSEYPPAVAPGTSVTPGAIARADFVKSIIGRLTNGEAIGEKDLLKAAEFAKAGNPQLSLDLARVVGMRMVGSTPFLQ